MRLAVYLAIGVFLCSLVFHSTACQYKEAVPHSFFPGGREDQPSEIIAESDRIFRKGDIIGARNLLLRHLVEQHSRHAETQDTYYFHLARQANLSGDYGLALHYWEEGWQLLDKKKPPATLGWWTWLYGSILANGEAMEEARLLCGKSLEFAIAAKDRHLQAHCFSCLGQAEEMRTAEPASLTSIPFHEDAVKIALALQDTSLLVRERLHMAKSFLAAEEWEKGARELSRAGGYLQVYSCEPLTCLFRYLEAYRLLENGQAAVGDSLRTACGRKAGRMGFTGLQHEYFCARAMEEIQAGEAKRAQDFIVKAWELDTFFVTGRLRKVALRAISGMQGTAGVIPILERSELRENGVEHLLVASQVVDRLLLSTKKNGYSIWWWLSLPLFFAAGWLVHSRLQLGARKQPSFLESESLEVNKKPTKEEAPLSENDQWVQEVRQVFEENMHRFKFTIDELAKELGMSRRQFYRRIKEATGLTPNQLLKQWRFEAARRFLLQPKFQSVKEVSMTVGMKNVEYFSRLYKEEFGVLPSEELKKRGKEER